jgi:hypothetical protein
MTKPFSVLVKSTFTILFACMAIPAFAQHGGGRGGGGFHGGGGGGFHGGGGGSYHPSGGGAPRGGSYAPPVSGYSGPRSATPYVSRSGGQYAARPGNSYARPGGNLAGGNQRFGNSPSARTGPADGQWRSFGGSSGGRGPEGAQAEGSAAGNSGGFHVFSGNRGTGSAGTVRSFSGQGGEVWETTNSARNVVPRSQSLSTLHNTFNGSLSANSGFRSSTMFSPSSRVAGGSSVVLNRGLSGSLNTVNRFRPLGGGFTRFGNRFNGFHGGCWNCGFGFGFGFGGWGFGWPWLGFGLWNPYWYGPWGFGPAYGYGYYPYPDNSVYGYPDPGYYAPPPDDNSNPPAEQDDQYQQDNSGPIDGNWVTPNGPSPSIAANAGNLAVPVLIYLKNGSVLTVRDYWMIDGDLHYILMSGAQRTVNLELVDLPRTNTENAKSGVRFIFKSEPSAVPPEPGGSTAPPAQPDSGQPTAIPQPEART